jgi:transcriptional regulator with XRE-family HTH domain
MSDDESPAHSSTVEAVSLETVIATNLTTQRKRARLSQEAVASALREMGHDTWSRSTLSQIEQGGRRVTAVELLHLAVALRTTAPDLLDPTRVTEGLVRVAGDMLPAQTVRAWLRGALVFTPPVQEGNGLGLAPGLAQGWDPSLSLERTRGMHAWVEYSQAKATDATEDQEEGQ